jgi:hypothetical protein
MIRSCDGLDGVPLRQTSEDQMQAQLSPLLRHQVPVDIVCMSQQTASMDIGQSSETRSSSASVVTVRLVKLGVDFTSAALSLNHFRGGWSFASVACSRSLTESLDSCLGRSERPPPFHHTPQRNTVRILFPLRN